MEIIVKITERESQSTRQITVALGDKVCLIGRKGADIDLGDPKCSRNHALLMASNDGVIYISDFMSRNGTFVDEQKIQEMTEAEGKVIRIGRTTLRIEKVQNLKTESLVVNSWPELYRAMPPEKQRFFMKGV